MKKPKFSLAHPDDELSELVESSGHKFLAEWAIACTERVLSFYEEAHPEDLRPRHALRTLQEWIETGKFSMAVIREASLASHAAAREAEPGSPAQSAARAAGQAVATAHVRTHALGAALYAQQAVHRAAAEQDAIKVVKRERNWQYRSLSKLHKEYVESDQ